MPDHDHMLDLLNEILVTHSPPGEEQEADAVLTRWFEPVCDEVWQDKLGNIIGLLRGEVSDDPLRIMAHKDEITLAVKRVRDDGRIDVGMCGALYPWKLGEVPVDILARTGIVKGALSIGSLHTSPNNPVRSFIEDKPLTIDDVYVNTTLNKAELTERGVYPGVKVVVAREHKKPIVMNHAVSGYHLDDKLALVVMQLAMEALHGSGRKPPQDVYFIATSSEEVGAQGAAFASDQLPGMKNVALEIGPVAEEYDVKLNEQPVIWYGPCIYSRKENDAMLDLANELGFGAQPAYIWGAGSDASKTMQLGHCSVAVCLAFACDNTHGYEVANLQGAANTATLLTEAIARGIF